MRSCSVNAEFAYTNAENLRNDKSGQDSGDKRVSPESLEDAPTNSSSQIESNKQGATHLLVPSQTQREQFGVEMQLVQT